MNRTLLASAICASLFVAGTAFAQDNTAPQQAQDQSATAPSTSSDAQQDEQKAKKLQTITVTGSLIPQSQIETANPVLTISSQDMIKKGYSNVYEALRAQPLSTGAVQDSQFSQGFTPGAQTISLLALSPDFTLFLIDGRPMADYPLLYNGSANFTDLSNIPMSMVDHIDILPGNQSSIYGSSAIAGVVNIILKKRMEGYNLNYRAGGYSQGGGQNQRLASVARQCPACSTAPRSSAFVPIAMMATTAAATSHRATPRSSTRSAMGRATSTSAMT
jgi:outer membrane receptor for ferrienterochelin and colicin